MTITPYKCPICDGKGMVDAIKCHRCDRGVIWYDATDVVAIPYKSTPSTPNRTNWG